MSEETARRTDWIDFAKGFVMIAVVEGHATLHLTPMNEFFATFRMPFFFVMAGFLLNLNKWGGKENHGKFLAKLSTRLLLPYYLTEILINPIWYVLCHKAGLLKYSWGLSEIAPRNALTAIFFGNGALILAPLWFLTALFVAEIIFINLFNFFGKLDFKLLATVIICAIIGFSVKKFSILPMGADITRRANFYPDGRLAEKI